MERNIHSSKLSLFHHVLIASVAAYTVRSDTVLLVPTISSNPAVVSSASVVSSDVKMGLEQYHYDLENTDLDNDDTTSPSPSFGPGSTRAFNGFKNLESNQTVKVDPVMKSGMTSVSGAILTSSVTPGADGKLPPSSRLSSDNDFKIGTTPVANTSINSEAGVIKLELLGGKNLPC